MPIWSLPRSAALLAVAATVLLSACGSHPYRVEEREVAVHVWLTAPDLAAQGGSIDALVYVGPAKVVEGPVRFEAGKPTVALPTAYVRAGTVSVSAVLGGGVSATNDRVAIEGESWVQVTLRGRAATLRVSEEQPDPTGR